MRNRSLADYEQQLKWLAIVQNWHPWPMFLGLPFCIIWMYCAWLHTERQLKYINIIFAVVYLYGIAKYFIGA